MYKISKGPYQNAGPAFEAIAKLAPKKDLIGLYYDDPDTVSLHYIYLCQLCGSKTNRPYMYTGVDLRTTRGDVLL